MSNEQKPARKAPDKSPENDMDKAIDLLRSARAKFIRQGDEKRADDIRDVIDATLAAKNPIDATTVEG